MKRVLWILLLAIWIACSVCLGASACDAVGGNLVQNCGFELQGCPGGCPYSGPLTDWTVTPGPGSYSGVCSNGACTVQDVHSGSFGYFFGNRSTTNDDSISQVISTGAGNTYQLSFWLYNMADMGASADFHVSWDGTTIFTASNNALPFTQFTVSVTGTGSDTLLFAGRGPNGDDWGLDDIALTQTSSVPEASSILLLGTLLVVVAAVFRKRAHRMQN